VIAVTFSACPVEPSRSLQLRRSNPNIRRSSSDLPSTEREQASRSLCPKVFKHGLIPTICHTRWRWARNTFMPLVEKRTFWSISLAFIGPIRLYTPSLLCLRRVVLYYLIFLHCSFYGCFAILPKFLAWFC
jgi:hypothetical protein